MIKTEISIQHKLIGHLVASAKEFGVTLDPNVSPIMIKLVFEIILGITNLTPIIAATVHITVGPIIKGAGKFTYQAKKAPKLPSQIAFKKKTISHQ